MSIEMENTKTAYEKIDAAWNLVEQIRIATTVGDKSHVMECVDRAVGLLFEAMRQLEEEAK